MSRVRPFFSTVLGLMMAVIFVAAPRAVAQLQVTLELNRDRFVAFEPIQVTVTIANRAGKDVILGDASVRKW